MAADFGPRWELVEPLSEGGQAHTYLVKEKPPSISEDKFVLKRLKNPKRRERFDQEVAACRRLDHPNILKIVDFGNLPGKEEKPYFVSPYCELGSLADQKVDLGSIGEKLALFEQICSGVAAAHTERILHRDLKPENIFLREGRVPVVGDFGICFVDEDETGQRLTWTLEVAGSRWYCAPELRDGRVSSESLQYAADVYSLGKVLYWMMSDGKVFDREDHRKGAYRIGQDNPAEPAFELINELLDKTIVADPAKRLPDARALLSAVRDLSQVIAAGGHAISLHVQHRCLFCAQGNYRVVVNGFEGASQAGTEAESLFGWGAPQPYPRWLIMVCEACGNVQAFRPDVPKPTTGLQNQILNEKLRRWTSERNT